MGSRFLLLGWLFASFQLGPSRGAGSDTGLAVRASTHSRGIDGFPGPGPGSGEATTRVPDIPWEAVAGRILDRGIDWIEARRQSWPVSPDDPLRNASGLDFRRTEFNPRGIELTDEDCELLSELMDAYERRLFRAGEDLWDAVSIGYGQAIRADRYTYEPDPYEGLECLGITSVDPVPTAETQVFVVPATGYGWRAEVPLVLDEHPAIAAAFHQIEKLRRLRVDALRSAISAH